MTPEQVKRIVEGALLAARGPVSVERLVGLFAKDELPRDGERHAVREALDALGAETEGRACELVRVASGYRFQVREELGQWVNRLFEGRPPRYSRALLETLAVIVYQQPATRGDIERVRGIAVGQSTMRTLLERGWIRVVGQRDTPGRPTMYGTTRQFLDYFNLKSLDELPPLEEVKALIEPALANEDAANASDQGETENESRPLAEVVQLPLAERAEEPQNR